MALSPQQQEIVEAYSLAAWLACNPDTTSPAEVADFATEALVDLKASIDSEEYFEAILDNAMLSSIHRAMVVRGMYLDAIDTFSRLNAIVAPMGIDLLDGHTYTEYVDSIIASTNR